MFSVANSIDAYNGWPNVAKLLLFLVKCPWFKQLSTITIWNFVSLCGISVLSCYYNAMYFLGVKEWNKVGGNQFHLTTV